MLWNTLLELGNLGIFHQGKKDWGDKRIVWDNLRTWQVKPLKFFQSSFENDFIFFRVHSDSEVWPSEGLEVLHCISEQPPQLESTSLQGLQKLWKRKDHGLRWWMPVYGIWRRQNKTNRQILSRDIRPSSISWYVCLFVLLDMCRFIIKRFNNDGDQWWIFD